MVGMALTKALYELPTWTRTVRLVAEHDGLRRVLGAAPSADACYRFTRKLREHDDLLATCVESVLAALRDEIPDLGATVAIDGSDLPAYANGQQYLSKGGKLRERYSDPDATWGHRSSISTRKGGGFYGYKVNAAVCTTTGLPLAWEVHTASDAEVPVVPVLLDRLAIRGIAVSVAVLDKGYDAATIYGDCEDRGIRPIIPLRQTPGSRPESTFRRPASTARGRSPVPMPSAARRSGVARPVIAPRRRYGSRPTGSTRSSRVRRSGGRACTTSGEPSSGSSAT